MAKKMDESELEKFRQFHEQRFQKQAEEIEKKRQRIISTFPKIAENFKLINAEKVVIYGSILSQRQFHMRSDLDMLIYGLDDNQWLNVFKQVDNIEELKDVSLDIKLAQDVNDDFKDFVINNCAYVCLPLSQSNSK